MASYPEAFIASFWAKVEIRGPDECWPWGARRDDEGYGQVRTSKPRQTKRAHIVAHEISKGPANGMLVCHSCDNPPCCNPSHLWLGSAGDNVRDSYAKGRRAALSPICGSGAANGNAKLSEQDVIEIKRMIAAGAFNTTIANIFGVSHSSIGNIRSGRTWKHI